jgi:CO dehydrogenase maturation factor
MLTFLEKLGITMKIAFGGKGGVGKTTITALIAKILRDKGHKVLVIDADPDMNLAAILGFPSAADIIPIVEMKELIAERTGAEPGKSASFFKLNPEVSDIPDKYCVEHKGIKLIVMGTVKKGGGGCACPENTFLKQLLSRLILGTEEWVLLDMEAGIEHLGRGTIKGIDKMFVVVEPNYTSIDTANRIKKLSKDIGLTNLKIIGNKVQNQSEKDFIKKNIKDFNIAGFIKYSDEIKKISTGQVSALDVEGKAIEEMEEILKKLIK